MQYAIHNLNEGDAGYAACQAYNAAMVKQLIKRIENDTRN